MEPEGKRAVFLDRDGVLIEDVGLLGDVSRIHVLPGVPKALKRLKERGFALLVVSNQAIVARGLLTEEQMLQLQQEVEARLVEAGAPPLDGFHYCPHHPHATLSQYRTRCVCRKPRPGLILEAARIHGISLPESFLVGDRPTDLMAGEAAGCRTVWVETGQHEAPIIETDGPLPEARPDHVCADLPAAADWILQQA